MEKTQEELRTAAIKMDEKFERDVRRQIQKGADINTRNKWGETFLHKAVQRKRPELVELLVARGADVNVRDNEGWTPLHDAVAFHSYGTAKFLLEHGADIHARFQDHDTPVHMAAWFNDVPLMKLMIKHGGDITDENGEQGTPLQTARYYRKEKTIRFLEEYNHQSGKQVGVKSARKIGTKRIKTGKSPIRSEGRERTE